MNKDLFATKIGEIYRFNDELDALNTHIGAIAPGAVCEYGARFLDDYIRILSELVGDDNGWISWYVFDNELGKRGFEAGYDGNVVKITSVDMLWELIELSKTK
jgi:hypothetical protein